ncbi:MAG: hypothetical protein AAF800_01680 [Planctomycetota bacterium]
MSAKEVLRQLTAQPFQPFVVVTSDRSRHEIRHPENARVIEGGLLFIFRPSNDPEAQSELPITLSLLHVTTLDPLRESAA